MQETGGARVDPGLVRCLGATFLSFKLRAKSYPAKIHFVSLLLRRLVPLVLLLLLLLLLLLNLDPLLLQHLQNLLRSPRSCIGAWLRVRVRLGVLIWLYSLPRLTFRLLILIRVIGIFVVFVICVFSRLHGLRRGHETRATRTGSEIGALWRGVNRSRLILSSLSSPTRRF